MAHHGKPEIFDTDQGSQFTGSNGIAISMDGHPARNQRSLHAKIGELTLENDFLEGPLSKTGLLSARR